MGFVDRIQRVFRGELPGGVPQTKRRVVAKTSDYTCVDSDSGTVFTTLGSSGDVDFTLPTIGEGNGWHAWFISATDNEMGIVSAGSNDNIVGFNDAAADEVRFTTASEQIGCGFYVVGDGTKWYCFVHLGQDSASVTIT